MQLLHATIACMCAAIISGFPTCQKIFMRQKCCSQLQRFVQSRDNDVDVDLCDVTVYWVSLLHYFNVQEIS